MERASGEGDGNPVKKNLFLKNICISVRIFLWVSLKCILSGLCTYSSFLGFQYLYSEYYFFCVPVRVCICGKTKIV